MSKQEIWKMVWLWKRIKPSKIISQNEIDYSVNYWTKQLKA